MRSFHLLVAAATALTAGPAAAAREKAEQPPKERKICRTVEMPGRITPQKICRKVPAEGKAGVTPTKAPESAGATGQSL